MMTPLGGLQQALAVQNRYPRADKGRLGLEQKLAQARIGQIEQGWQQHPGRMPGGSGTTGLASGDKHGWSQMLNEQTEHQNLQNTLAGKPLSVVQLERSLPRYRSPQKPLPESHDAFMRRYGR